MNNRTKSALCVVVGLLVCAVAVTAISPVGDRPMTSRLVDEGPPPAGESAIPYSALSQPARDAVDDVLRDEFVTYWTYDNYEKLETLPRVLHVEKGGDIYRIRTTSADGGGGLVEGLLHDTLLGAGGLLIAAGVYLVGRRRRLFLLFAFPVASTAAVLGGNAIQAPDLALVSWTIQASTGIAVAAPVLMGVAGRRQDLRVGGIAVATLVCAFGVLSLEQGSSPLGAMAGLGLLTIPGVIGGWWLGGESWAEMDTE